MGYQVHATGYLSLKFYEFLLYDLLKKNKQLFFIQIGAHDGISFDPIHDFIIKNHRHVSGIVIEPVGEYFSLLSENYRSYPNIIPVQAAIHNSEKEMALYRVDPGKLSDYSVSAKGASTFNKEKLVNSDGIDREAIVSETVPCISLSKLVADRKIKTIDFLQIDAEGYDFEIVSAIDFDRIKPRLIHFEHGLSKEIMSQQNLDRLTDLLHQHSYELWRTEWDVIAYHSDSFFD